MTAARLHAVIALFSGFCEACNGESSSGGELDASPRGDAGSSTTTPATASEVEDLCIAQCDRSERCNPSDAGLPEESPQACRDSCSEKLDPLGASVRADIVRALTDCTSDLPCDTNDDICTDRAVTATGQSIDAAIHAPEVQACLQKEEECRDTPGDYSDDLCGSVVLLIDSKRSQAASCFNQACDAVGPCLEPIFGP